MIQRIQTLYLFLAAILSTLGAYFLPMYGTETETFAATASMYTFLLFGVNMVLFSLSILMYKRRPAQLLLVRLGMLSALAVQFQLIYQIMSVEGAAAKFGVIVPFITVILAFMASKGIQKDEEKIRSLDRLR